MPSLVSCSIQRIEHPKFITLLPWPRLQVSQVHCTCTVHVSLYVHVPVLIYMSGNFRYFKIFVMEKFDNGNFRKGQPLRNFFTSENLRVRKFLVEKCRN